MKQVENLIKNQEASRELNKDNSFKSYSLSLFSHHTVKETGPTTITNIQSASVLLQNFNLSKTKFNVQRDKSNQTKDIITTHHNNIEERNQKPQ